MSFSVGTVGTKDEVAEKLNEAFDNNYPEPADGVREMFSLGSDFVERFAGRSEDDGNYSVSISGHAKQSDVEGDRDWLSVSINAAS